MHDVSTRRKVQRRGLSIAKIWIEKLFGTDTYEDLNVIVANYVGQFSLKHNSIVFWCLASLEIWSWLLQK